MKLKVKSFITHQALFIKGWGSLGNHIPNAGRTIPNLTMIADETGIHMHGDNLEHPGKELSAFVPMANVVALIYTDNE